MRTQTTSSGVDEKATVKVNPNRTRCFLSSKSRVILWKMQRDVEEEPQPPEEAKIEVEIPKINMNLNSKNIHFVKLPNFLSVETRFDCHKGRDLTTVTTESETVPQS